MSTTLPPTGDTPDGAASLPPQALPDETALRRVFDEQFQPLIESASRELGAAAPLAPRVVEAAFVRAWEQRNRFQARTGLDAFLVDDVHHGVARTLSRRAAAHRLGHHEELHGAPHAPGTHASGTHTGDGQQAGAVAATTGTATATVAPPVDRELAWQHILHTIHDQGPSHAARTHHVEVSRHDAAQHVAAIGRTGSWWPWALAAVVALVAIFGAIRWADSASADSVITRALAAQDTRAATSGRGQMANVTLGDGSVVRLAPETRVTIPKDFGERLRAVRVEGAASFEAKPGLERGLQVHAGSAVVTTTGTTFTVRAWPGEDVFVQVASGTVTVRAGGTDRALAAGEAIVVGADSTMRAPDDAARRTAMAWTEGRIVTPKIPLDKVLVQLRRWYDLDVGLADPALATREVALDVPTNAPKEAIAAIEAQANVKYGYAANNDKVFRDASAAATPAAAAKKK
jgi:transmembrane sensor